MLANTLRLPPLAPHHTSIISPHHTPPHTLEHSHGQFDPHLAGNEDPNRRCTHGRRLAVLRYAIASYPPVGEHCPFPQADTMDDLLANGANDEATPRSLPRR